MTRSFTKKMKDGLTASAAAGAILLTGAIAAPLSASAAEIVVYADAFYSGGDRRYTDSIANLSDDRFNDRISSIRVERGVWTVCTDRNFRGRCETVNGDISNLASTIENRDFISLTRL